MGDRPEHIAGVEHVDLAGKHALVTGSTSGIGRETALALGRLGADVMVHGRDAAAGAAVVDELTAMGREATFQQADYASVDDVRGLAAAVQEWTDDLDVLCNNAGGLFRDGRLTDLGVEYTFHVNHLAPYLLTAELLETLADDARIVTTSSGAHRGVELDFEAIESVDSYSGFRAYQRSKLANVLFSTALAHRLDRTDRSISSNAFHPGAIPGSGFSRFLPGPLPRLFATLDRLPMTTTVAEGAATAVSLAASPRVDDVSGRYFADCEPKEPSAAARDRATQRRLWEQSADLLEIDEPLADGRQ
ncbi:SDR family NAD(P)-dependent oxidoreductase [Halohasta litorea]|uniref:SDR family NAD(P)-dependent oxidoreductase n=1 Tax=Halohasta litorea TaxID=869891 RepID=A0ABD6D8P7_9EURY|nr:SDR family NAD(P)-dependent oxidoreductase [Halohasta litorea]